MAILPSVNTKWQYLDMDVSNLPAVIEWARKHVTLALFCVILTLVLYASYAFIGGYATRFGETFAGSYNSFARTVVTYTVVDAVLHDYLIKYRGSRIAIGRFHDNVHDLSNNSMFYVSFETVLTAPGVASDQAEVANLSASIFSHVLPELIDNQAVMLNTYDMSRTPLRELAERYGTHVMLFIPIRDLSDRLIAMVMLSWLSEADVPGGEERVAMIKTLMSASIKIGGYLSSPK